MKIEILEESGHKWALLGLSLSRRQPVENMPEVAVRLASKDGGHNKFLEFMMIYLDITAPRFWWQQFDTYRIGITKQSESTMHTILERLLTQDDFSEPISPGFIDILNHLIAQEDFHAVKAHLPESFLQRRIVCTNYNSVRRIIKQRLHHRLKEWQRLLNFLYENLEHPEYLSDLME